MTIREYLAGPEEMRPRELIFGVVRDAPSPFADHQKLVTRLTVLLDTHVREQSLGLVLVAPIDVILDEERALIVQPDVVFISAARLGMVRRQIWGAPDLVVEVGSPGTARYDRTMKLGWYEKYGCRECWLVEPLFTEVTIHTFGANRRTQKFANEDAIESVVLPELRLSANHVFET